MPSSHWQVFSHGPLRQLDDDLWIVSGSLPRLPFPRNMLVYRHGDDELLVWSAVALDRGGMRQLEGLGRPSVLVIPNRQHRMQALAYQERYPGITTACPVAARSHIEPGVPVDVDVEVLLPELGILCHAPPGVDPSEPVYEFPLAEGMALAFTDLLFNLEHQGGLSGLFMRLIGITGGLKVTRIARWRLVEDAVACGRWLRDMAGNGGLELLLVGHGEPITENCGGRLAEAAAPLS